MIEKKILNSSSGKSYYNALKVYLSNNNYQTLSEELSQKLFGVPNPNSYCNHISKDTSFIYKSRFITIVKGFQGIIESVDKMEGIDFDFVGKETLKVIKEEDLNHPLYKIMMLKFLAIYPKPFQDKGISIKLPPWAENEPEVTKLNKRNVLSVLVNNKNELFVRDKKMNVKNLRLEVKEFVSNPYQAPNYAERPDKAIISLKNDRGTDYKAYIEVYNEIKGAYNELRNEEALRSYGKDFEDVNSDQQKTIRAKIPLVISESEPTAFGEED